MASGGRGVSVGVGMGVSEGRTVAASSVGVIEGVASLQEMIVWLSRITRITATHFRLLCDHRAGLLEWDNDSKDCLYTVDWRVFYYNPGVSASYLLRLPGMEDATFPNQGFNMA